MASWPTQGDYKDALQNPDTAFRDPDLRASQAERSPMGVPRARSGAFASVYKMTGPKGAVALKLFNFPNEDRASRYLAVSEYLKKLGPKRPGAMVGFAYQPEGIRVGKGWYPTLTMEWVKGKSLGEWVREAMERKAPDTAAVRAMADAWKQLVLDIQAAEIAHGDLQHDNVMVVGNKPVLVDYDGMCVPALAPADPKKKLDQLEFGKPAYQHPARPVEKLSPHLDHFAAWVILVALRAMVADPSLYVRYVTKTENENLLFTPPDMQNPAGSALWPELIRSKDAETAGWAKMLREALDKPFDQIPPFNFKPKDPFAKLRALLDAIPRDWAAIPAEKAALAKDGKAVPPDLQAEFPKRLRTLCGAAKKDYPAIVAEADGMARGGEPVPPDVKPAADDAARRVACREAVQAALDAGDPRAVKAAFQRLLLDGWVERRLVTDAEAAVGQVEVLDRMKAAFETNDGGKKLVDLWAREGFKVGGLPEAARYQAEAERWEKRVTAAEAFVRVFTGSAPTEKALAAAWAVVEKVGPHPFIIKPEHAARGQQAVRWAPVVERLRAVPDVARFKFDRELDAAWRAEGDIKLCAEAVALAGRVVAAQERLTKTMALKRAIEAADSPDAAAGAEEAIVAAADLLPKGYEHPYADRVAHGSESVRALGALRAAVEQERPSDRAVAAAVDDLRRTNVELLARLDKIDATLAAEAAAAGRRRKALNEFAEIDGKYPEPDEQDRRWLALWLKHKPLLHGRRDTDELRERYTRAVRRTKAWAAFEEALNARDMFKLKKIRDEYGELLQNYPPLAARQDEADVLLAKADRVMGIQKKLTAPDAVPNEDDLQFLRENHEAFGAAAKDAIAARVAAKLKGDAKLVAGYPPIQVVPSGPGVVVKASWAWPGHGLVSHCLVAVDRAKHLNSPTEADQFGLMKCRVQDHTRDVGGKIVAPPRGAGRVFVTVWAVVELGWTTVHGPPLHLGPVSVGGR